MKVRGIKGGAFSIRLEGFISQSKTLNLFFYSINQDEIAISSFRVQQETMFCLPLKTFLNVLGCIKFYYLIKNSFSFGAEILFI